MTDISVELIPRTPLFLDAQLSYLYNHRDYFSHINIPDLKRMTLRSWQGCAQARYYFSKTIPHLRAIDFDNSKLEALVSYLNIHQINEVLVIRGDPPADIQYQALSFNSCRLIYKLKQLQPKLCVYAAIDPYRNDIHAELHYLQEKLEAGCDGFFTQPFFDLLIMERFRQEIREFSDRPIFWWVSPVVGVASQNYWQKTNHVHFPDGFDSTLNWNKCFALKVLSWAKENNENVYFMPLRIELDEYFSGLLY